MKKRVEHAVTRSILTTDPDLRTIEDTFREMEESGWEFAGTVRSLIKYPNGTYASSLDEFLVWKRPCTEEQNETNS